MPTPIPHPHSLHRSPLPNSVQQATTTTTTKKTHHHLPSPMIPPNRGRTAAAAGDSSPGSFSSCLQDWPCTLSSACGCGVLNVSLLSNADLHRANRSRRTFRQRTRMGYVTSSRLLGRSAVCAQGPCHQQTQHRRIRCHLIISYVARSVSLLLDKPFQHCIMHMQHPRDCYKHHEQRVDLTSRKARPVTPGPSLPPNEILATCPAPCHTIPPHR